MTWQITVDGEDYATARETFEWDVPEGFNAARDAVRKHEDIDQVALYQSYPDGRHEQYTFADLDRWSNRLANALAAWGVERGDRVAVVLSQTPANPVTHLACWKLGAVSIPLSVLFGDRALRYRFDHSGARVAVVDASVTETVGAVAGDCSELERVLTVSAVNGAPPDVETASGDTTFRPFEAAVKDRSETFDIADTDVDTPAVVLYTSGSTGPPKGAVHGHGVWLGHCPGFYSYFERDVDDGVFWTPADWAWIGALGDLVFPAWHYGRPVVGHPMQGFDPTTAFEICERYDVTHGFVPPTAIRMLMNVSDPTERYDLALRAISSGGEPLTPEILEWAEEALDGTVINELYGQTEANLLVCHCRELFPGKVGSMGRPVPGHEVAVVDPDTGDRLPEGEVGEIAVERGDDPVVFTEYWRDPDRTAVASVGDWHLTGDLGYRDADGYFHFKSRDDDLIITSGYRVGPGEVERAILDHDAVEQVGVVGVPDDTRGEVIKAFVEPVAGVEGSDELRASIRDLVRSDLAKYEYPRQIAFREELPQTTTGKIRRRDLRPDDET
jgi:acetyl-CoA synthetase